MENMVMELILDYFIWILKGIFWFCDGYLGLTLKSINIIKDDKYNDLLYKIEKKTQNILSVGYFNYQASFSICHLQESEVARCRFHYFRFLWLQLIFS